MKKITVITILFSLFAGNVHAKEVDAVHARNVAAGFASSLSLLRGDAGLRLVYEGYKEDGETQSGQVPYPLYHVYNIGEGDGFVIVAGDDLAMPVLAYSDQAGFSPEEIPDNVKYWLSFYKQEIAHAIGNSSAQSDEVRQAWENLPATKAESGREGKLLETALWGQSAPYNNRMPMDGRRRSVAGCVATAMAIVMQYHNWPERGEGETSYTTRENKITISASLGEPYDWANMPDVYATDRFGRAAYTEEEAGAVAGLMYDCAVTVEMDFTATASSAYTTDILDAMRENFDYDEAMYMLGRDYYSTGEWYNILRQEIDASRPVIYGGRTSEDSGHSFVIDGYDAANYFHVNWGWNGSMNGYFLLSSLNPESQGIGGNDNGLGYNWHQDAIIGIRKPQAASKRRYEMVFYPELLEAESLGIYSDVETIRQDEPFLLYFSLIAEYGFQPFDGYVGIFHMNKDGGVKEELDTFAMDVEAGMGIHDITGTEFKIGKAIQPGDYITLFYSLDGKLWTPVRGSRETVTEYPLTNDNVANGQVFDPPLVELSSPVMEEEVAIRPAYGVDLRQASFIDLSGRIVKEVSLSGNENVSISLSGMKPGIYILRVQADRGIFKFKTIKK